MDNKSEEEGRIPQAAKLTADSLSDKVALHIENLIVGKQLPPGAKLPSESDLATDFGVSRSVVRDAMRLLAGKGMVEVRQGRNVRVTLSARAALTEILTLSVRRGDYSKQELIQARRFVESQAALLAARRRSPADVATLSAILAGFKASIAAQDWPAAERCHAAFHLALVECSGNQLLSDFIGPVLDASLAYLKPLITDGDGWSDYQTHEELLQAIAAGDTGRTCDLMEQHMRRLEIEKEIDADAQDPVDPAGD